MEMDVLQGYTVIKSGACFHFGEMDIYVSRGMSDSGQGADCTTPF